MSLPRLFYDRPRSWLLVLILILGLSAWGITRIRLQTDMMKMMPAGDPAFSAFEKSIRHFGGIDNLIVVMRVDPEGDLDEVQMFADALAGRLRKLKEPVEVTWRLPDPKPYLRLFFSNLAVLSTSEEWAALKAKLSSRGMRDALLETRIESQSFLAPGIKEFLALDPLRLHRIYQGRFSAGEGMFKVDVTSGYLLSEDHRMMLLVVKPDGAAQDIAYAGRLVGQVRGCVDATLAEFKGQGFAPDVDLGGGFRIAVEDGNLIRGDMILQIISSLITVLLLFWLCFGRFSTLLFAVLPLGLGLLLTYGFAGWTLNELNVASSSFAALLIGLGIDFIIVSYGRYVEERNGGRDFLPTLEVLERETFPGVLFGALTTMATFGAFLVVKMRGLKELGFVTATGICLIMLVTFTVFPAILYLDDRYHRRRNRYPKLKISSFGTEALLKGSIRHARALLIGGAVLFVLMTALAVTVPFVDDAQSIRSESNRGVVLQKEMQDHFGRNTYPSVVLMETGDARMMFERDAALGAYLDGLQAKGIVARHTGLSSFVPLPAAQQANLRRAGELDPVRLRREFDVACRELSLDSAAFSPFWDSFGPGLVSPRVLDWEALSAGELQSLISTLAVRSQGRYFALHSIFFDNERYRREAPPELEAWVGAHPGYALTGVNVMAKHLRNVVKSDALLATLIGLVAVAFILWLDFRSWRLVGWCLIPLSMGIACMLGSMRLLGMPLNSLNIYVTAMVIGIGVDYSIYVLHRHASSGGDSHLVAQTGKAIFFAALTTIAGFGSLVFSHFPGLRSMGFVAVFGTFFCALFSLTILPALLHWRDSGRGNPEP